MDIHVSVRWEGFGLRAATYRSRREMHHRLEQLYDTADTAGDE
jgi:hypothetical protein